MKILISDIDKTLYFGKHEEKIKRRDLEKINELQSQGHMFGVCTGRSLSGVKKFIDLDNLTFDFMILSSGAIIVEHNGKFLKHETVDRKDIVDMLQCIHSIDCNPSFTIGNSFYYKSEFTYSGEQTYKFNSFDEVPGQEFDSFALEFNDVDTLEKAQKLLNDSFSDVVSIHRNDKSLDIAPNGCSKGNAVKQLQAHYNLESKDVFAIGDSFNDISMFEAVENSFTFFNSPLEVQKKASHLVSSIADSIEIILASK